MALKRRSGVCPDVARNAAGFTLIELAVTVAVLAVLLAIALPSFETLSNQNRLGAASNQVIATLQTARVEAIRQNRKVMICDSADGAQCRCCERRWRGLLLAQPEGESGSRSLAFTPFNAPVEFMPGAAFNKTSWNLRVAYRADGRPASGSAPSLPSPITLRVCIPTSRPANNIRDVVLHPSGRVDVKDANGGGACPFPDTTPG